MSLVDFASTSMSGEDLAYKGSRYSDVRDVIFANPYQGVWGRDGEAPLPRYEVSLFHMLRGILPFTGPHHFRRASERTVDSFADLRFGEDGKGFRRIVHQNGVCMTGLWEITEDVPYSGYFRSGSSGLVIGRLSVCCATTRRGEVRSMGLAGKLYPTTDRDHTEPLRTAAFFVQQDFGGTRGAFINEAELRNAPDATPWTTLTTFPMILVTSQLFKAVDVEASIRQLHEIAELGKPAGEPTRTPQFMRLTLAADQPRIEGEELDFRDEVMAQIYDKGDPAPKRKLVFEIDVTDEGSFTRSSSGLRRKFDNWRRIGRISFDDAVVSYNGDFVLHFHHPGWRTDRNNPETRHRKLAPRA